MNRVKWWLTVGAVSAASLLLAQEGKGMTWEEFQNKMYPVREYSVTDVHEMAGGVKMNMKKFKSGRKSRTEMEILGLDDRVIILQDEDAEKGLSYNLWEDAKIVAKVPVPVMEDEVQGIKVEELGKEEVDGVPCDKYRVTLETDSNGTTSMLYWTSPEEKNMTVKVQDVDHAMIIRSKDYSFEKLSENLFKIPPEYPAPVDMQVAQEQLIAHMTKKVGATAAKPKATETKPRATREPVKAQPARKIIGMDYDAATRTGTLKVGVGPREDKSYAEAYKWALDNIGTICSSKEIAMEAGKAPPQGARYKILSEKTTDDGVLEITFEVLQ